MKTDNEGRTHIFKRLQKTKHEFQRPFPFEISCLTSNSSLPPQMTNAHFNCILSLVKRSLILVTQAWEMDSAHTPLSIYSCHQIWSLRLKCLQGPLLPYFCGHSRKSVLRILGLDSQIAQLTSLRFSQRAFEIGLFQTPKSTEKLT